MKFPHLGWDVQPLLTDFLHLGLGFSVPVPVFSAAGHVISCLRLGFCADKLGMSVSVLDLSVPAMYFPALGLGFPTTGLEFPARSLGLTPKMYQKMLPNAP